MSDYNIPVSGGVNGLNVPLHGHIAVYNKEFPVIPNPEGEVTGYVTKLGFTPEILQVKDPEVHDWARAEEKPTYTKAEVGLGDVDNTSDLDKPISTATQTALDEKVDKIPGKALSTNDYTDTDKAIVDGVTSALATKVDKIAGKGLSSNDYTDYEKSKLAYIQPGAEVNVQADWFESNRWSDAFILNKPTKLSDFSNDTGFITSIVDNLTYYYKKSETYTQAEVNALIGSIVTISFLVVQTLPQTGEANIIYLVPADEPNPDNIYEEYIYVNYNWEMIGTTKVDLSNYYTKTETNTLLIGKVDKDGDKVLSDNNYSDTDKTKLDGIEANANHTEVDTEISSTSENPLQNKAIYDLLNDLLPEGEATGNPISISNASGFNAKALTVDMLPIQDLHGYDKPWAGGSGKNKFDINKIWTGYDIGSTERCKYYHIDLPQGTYTVSTNVIDNTNPNVASVLVTNFKPVTSPSSSEYGVFNNRPRTITATEGLWVFIRTQSSAGYLTWNENTFAPYYIQVESGSTATSYEPYANICPISGRNSLDITVNGETKTINLGETVYGGTCDVVGGGTSVTNSESTRVKISSLSWTYQDNFQRFFSNTIGNVIKLPPTLDDKLEDFICECYNNNSFRNYQNGDICVTNVGNLFAKDDNYTDVTTWLQAVGDYYISYPLKNPTTINTPATPISLNKGNNTLSTSGDNMDLKYSTTISNPTPSLGMVLPTFAKGGTIPTIDSTEDTRLLDNANIDVVEEPTEVTEGTEVE